MTEPRFKVGDFVVLKLQSEYARLYQGKDKPWRNDAPPLFHVVEVVTQTCVGGTQVTYVCRMGTSDAHSVDYNRFNEMELLPAPTEPAPASDKE